MQMLTIDPAQPYLIPADAPIHVLLVGCGGTGSHIAQSLARLAYHVSQKPGLPPLIVTLLDGDVVESKNVGRQLFSAGDVGTNKAQALAARFSAVFGLPIAALPRMLGDWRSPELDRTSDRYRSPYGVIVGAVDGPSGRTAIRELMKRDSDWRLWLDCGNEQLDGQVVVGGATTPEQLRGAFKVPGLCSALPAPSLVYPDLLKQDTRAHVTRLDCDEAMLTDAQSLMVNQAMAAIAGQYLYAITIGRRLTTFETRIDMGSLSMRSQPTTAAAVAAATGVSRDVLAGAEKPKKSRAKARVA